MIKKIPYILMGVALVTAIALAASDVRKLSASFQPPDGEMRNGALRRNMSLVTARLVEVGGCQYVIAAKSSEESAPAILHHAACPNHIGSKLQR